MINEESKDKKEYYLRKNKSTNHSTANTSKISNEKTLLSGNNTTKILFMEKVFHI